MNECADVVSTLLFDSILFSKEERITSNESRIESERGNVCVCERNEAFEFEFEFVPCTFHRAVE
jgi:hypothetical protein